MHRIHPTPSALQSRRYTTHHSRQQQRPKRRAQTTGMPHCTTAELAVTSSNSTGCAATRETTECFPTAGCRSAAASCMHRVHQAPSAL
jgi:hypothetical protein